MPISLGFIALIAFGNLRGVRESGRIFAAPTFFFMFNMAVLLGLGLVRYLTGDLQVLGERLGHGRIRRPRREPDGGRQRLRRRRAFASRGAAVTGVEAISNGVPAFRKPEWRNARQTLVVMGSGLAVMFLGLSFLASKVEVAPFEDGTPTVLAQIGEAVYGHGSGASDVDGAQHRHHAHPGAGRQHRLRRLPAAGEPAGRRQLPRQLTRRGHRLVFSNGILALAGAAVLVVLTGAEVTRLIPLYAISVFTGFTLSQSGMTRHHLRKREPGWVAGLLANGVGAVLSGLIVLIVVIRASTTPGRSCRSCRCS